MSEDKDRRIIDPKSGIFADLAVRVKLILRLVADPRVSPFLKLLPVGSVLYFLIPDIAPGPIDDVAVIWLGAYLFVEMCPPDVVQEHMAALKQVAPGEWHDPDIVVGEFVDAEFQQKDKDEESSPELLDRPE
ncbi:MAG: hypothetical protein JXA78_02505 [Anaerolineales bacterium]|nr:hypothetical protein [Anaerolineales bacterium]